MDCSSKSIWLPNIFRTFLKKDRSGFVIGFATLDVGREHVIRLYGLRMLCDFHEESHLYQCVQDTLMNNKKHVGSLAIGCEPRNMRTCICFIVYFSTFLANFRNKCHRKHDLNIKLFSK